MRFAARLLPLAAAAATLAVAVQPALAADPACAPPAAQTSGLKTLASVASTPSAPVVPGELVVRYRDAAAADAGTRRLAAAGAAGRRVNRRVALVRLPKGRSLNTATAALRRDRNVLWVEPNYLYRAERTPNDALFSQQWALNNAGGSGRTADADIDAPEAWNVTTGSPSVLVGIVDTGLDASHPDLAPNLALNSGESGGGREANGVDDDGNGFVDDVRGWDFAADDNDPNDTYGHGSHVAGTIGARGDDGRGVAGIAWQVGLLPLRALNDQGVGSSLDIAAAMTYAAGRGARVVNISLGGAGFSNAMLDAICGAPNTLFVVAAGNNGKDVEATPFYPCAYTAANILCVAATDANDALAGFSNTGAVSVDLAAPGTQILSTVPGGGHALYSGTSMATPHVAGAAALVLSRHPEWTAQQVKDALVGSVDPLPSLAGKTVTGGRLNVARAVNAGAAATAPTVTTDAPTAVTSTTATLAATVDPAGVDGALRFEYGPTPDLGTATAPLPVAAAAGATAQAQAIAGLVPGTPYYVRAVLATPAGDVAGAVVSFATPLVDVRVATGAATPSGRASARLTGTVTAASAVSYRFEFGATTAYGRSTATRRLAATTGPATVALQATGLQPGRVYHYRLVVSGPAGAVRGADRTIVVGQSALRVRRATTVGSRLRVTVRVPGRGRVMVVVTGRSGGRHVTFGRTARVARKAGLTTLTVRLTSAARRLRATGAIDVTVTFTASGDRAASGRTVRV